MDDALSAFQRFMDGGGPGVLIVWSLFLTALFPVLTLVHELGHAAVALLRTDTEVRVHVGREPGKLRFRIGRLSLSLDAARSGTRRAGYTAAVIGRLSRRERIAWALAGPAAEAAAGLALVVAGERRASLMLLVGGVLGVLLAFANLVPVRWHGVRLDGRHALDAFQGRPPETVRVARADALFNERERSLTPLRIHLLGGAPTTLGHAADDRGTEALDLWNVAFAGWCWRESELDPLDVGAAAKAALDHARSHGVGEPNAIVVAAAALARSSAEFGEDFDDVVPRGDERRRFAFRYGGALREIERLRE